MTNNKDFVSRLLAGDDTMYRAARVIQDLEKELATKTRTIYDLESAIKNFAYVLGHTGVTDVIQTLKMIERQFQSATDKGIIKYNYNGFSALEVKND